jgi:hypothetical protein
MNIQDKLQKQLDDLERVYKEEKERYVDFSLELKLYAW